MMLGLGSGCAPDATFEDLVDICVRRGFAALELEEGHAHGMGARRYGLEPEEAARLAARRGVLVAAYRATAPMSTPAGGVDPRHSRVARVSGALGALLVLDDKARVGARVELAAALADAGVRVAVAVRGPRCLEDADVAGARGVDIVWDADPQLGDVDGYGRRLLDAHRPRLRGIRLAGGGPETALHAGAGIGELVRTLALARWDGSMVVTPTSTRYRVAWRTWLGRSGGSGCTGTSPDTTLVELLAPANRRARARAAGS